MTNLKTIFKQKSKLLLIVLSLLGMIFSYSCSCRNDRITGGDGNGNDGEQGSQKSAFVTGEAEGNNYLIRLSSTGSDKDSATIKFTNGATVELGHIDNGSTGLNFIKTDFNYSPSDGKLSLTEEGKKKLDGKEGTSNSIKVNFNLSTTSSDYTDASKNQTKSVNIAIGKIKVWDMKSDVAEVLITVDNSVDTASGVSFELKDGSVIGNGGGIKLVPKSNRDYADGTKVGKKQFGDKLIALLSSHYYIKDYLIKLNLKTTFLP